MRLLQSPLLVLFCVFFLNSVASSAAETDNTSFGAEVSISTPKSLRTTGWREEQTTACVVGWRRVNGQEIVFRVINGQKAKQGEVPYQVSLRKRVPRRSFFMNFCGGAVITPKEVLSAAHCFKETTVFDRCCSNSGQPEEKRIRGVYAVAGTIHTVSHFHGDADTEEHGQWRRVRSVRYPTNFNFPSHDIAIVFITGSYTWTATVQPIPYAETKKKYKGSCLVSGYGRMKDKHRSLHLLTAELRLLDEKTCTLIHHTNMEDMICASDKVSDIGKGDSGGPLVCKNTDDPKEANSSLGILVGVVSGSKKDTKDGSFFTRTSSHVKFIKDTIKEDAMRLQSNKLVVASAVVGVLFGM